METNFEGWFSILIFSGDFITAKFEYPSIPAKSGLFFVRFSGKSKQVLVRNFELDHFEIELVIFLS